MKKMSSKQVQKINDLADNLRYYGFENVRVNFDSHWVITAERDWISSTVFYLIPRTMSFYYSDGVLSISLI